MKSTSAAFESNAVEALLDPDLQASLNKMGFRAARQRVVDEVPEWEAIRAAAREIKEHTLAHLDYYLEQFESKVVDQSINKYFDKMHACSIKPDNPYLQRYLCCQK